VSILRGGHRALLVLMILTGLAIRVVLLPYSTGSDIPQFYGFTTTFLKYGLNFYQHAFPDSWIIDGWPYPWPYVYPPLPLLMFTVVRLFVFGMNVSVSFNEVNNTVYMVSGPVTTVLSSNYEILYVWVSKSWFVPLKVIFIVFDTLVCYLIYVISGRGCRGLIASTLYFLNPMTIYISSIYGMFDQVMIAFYLISLYLLVRGKWELSGVFAGLALVTKQTVTYPLTLLIVRCLRSIGKVKYFIVGIALPTLVIILPFVANYESFKAFLKLVFTPSEPYITTPIFYSFNGVSSLCTFLYLNEGGDVYLLPIKLWFIPFAVLYGLLVLNCLFRDMDVFEVSFLGYMCWTATYWRVNHQYLVPLIALAVPYVFTRRGKKFLRALTLFLTLYIGLWFFMFPMGWWFKVHIYPNEVNWGLVNLWDTKLSLMIFEDKVYVAYALVLTALQYAILIANLTSATAFKSLVRTLRKKSTLSTPKTHDHVDSKVNT